MEMVPDEQIAGEIIARITHDPRIPNKSDVKIEVENGVVQLYGEVNDPLQRDAAGELASTAPGVKQVVNSLGVVIDRPVLSDRDIAKMVEEALSSLPEVTLKEIGVQVKNGFVTLVGHVDTYKQVYDATRAAESVKGVNGVIDNLIIGEVPPDEAIAIVDDALIKSLVDAALDDNDIEVFNNETVVSSGRVYLRGNVNTDDEKRRATGVARAVQGVRVVENQLVVWLSERSTNPDEVLSAAVEHALGRNPKGNPVDIKVQCFDGVCHLFGETESIDDRNAAIEAAGGVKGVRKVIDDITIMDNTTEPSDDKGSVQRRKTRR